MSANTTVAERSPGGEQVQVFEVQERAIYTVVVPPNFEREDGEEDEQRAERYFMEVGVGALAVSVEDRDAYGVEERDGAGDCVVCESRVCDKDCPRQRALRGLDPYAESGTQIEVMKVYSNDDFWVVVNGRIGSIFYGEQFRESDVITDLRVAELYAAVGLRAEVRVLDLTERLDAMVFTPGGDMLDFSCETDALESLLRDQCKALWDQASDPCADPGGAS